MKILLATFWLLPHVGGVWTYMQALEQHLTRCGHEVEFLGHTPDDEQIYKIKEQTYFNKKKIKPIVEEHVQSYYNQNFPALDKWMRIREVGRYTFELASAALGVDGYDLIHTQDVISTRAIARIKPRNTPLVATIHGSLPHEDILRGAMAKGYLPWHYSSGQEHVGTVSSDITIVPSNWLKQLMIHDIFVPADHMTVIPYGMDTHTLRKRAREPLSLRVPDDKKLLVCPARLDRIKGQESLLDALAMLKQDRTDWVCWLAGDGYMREALEQQCKNLGLTKHVVFLGPRDDLPAILKAADVVVLPSLQDNQPFVIMEAQVLGRAVVSTDAGGIPEMIQHEHTGLISPRGESVPLYRNLARVVSDRSFRKQLGANAKQWGRSYWSLERMVENTMPIYRKFISGV